MRLGNRPPDGEAEAGVVAEALALGPVGMEPPEHSLARIGSDAGAFFLEIAQKLRQ